MSKLIHITDIKPIEIFLGRKTRGPVTMRMDNEVIRRLLNSLDGPDGIYAVSKTGKEIKLTDKNYMLTEEELFNPVITFTVKEPIIDTERKSREEALKRSIEAMKLRQQKSETKSEEISEPKDDGEVKTDEDTASEETNEENDITEKEEDSKSEEVEENVKPEEPVSNNVSNTAKPANITYNHRYNNRKK